MNELSDNLVPNLNIQCDWDDIINKTNAEIWVACKYRDQKSTDGKLRCLSGQLPRSDSEDFAVISLEEGCLHLKHRSGNQCVFVPATNTYSDIHKKNIMSLDTSDGGLGVSVSNDNKIHVWNAETGQTRKILEGHVGDVYKCKFFPSGIVILSCSADMQLKIWSAETGQCPVTLKGHKGPVTDISLIERGRNIVSVSKDGSAKLWDVGESNCLATLLQLNPIAAINCCDVGYINEDLIMDSQSLNNETNPREIGTEDKLLLVGTEDGFVYGIHIYTRKTVFTINIGTPINTVKYLKKDHFIVGCQDGRVIIYNMLKCDAPSETYFESNSSVISCCLYKHLGFFCGHNDGSVTYIHTDRKTPIRLQLTGSDFDPIYDLSVGLDCVFTACRDGKIRRYQVLKTIQRVFQ